MLESSELEKLKRIFHSNELENIHILDDKTNIDYKQLIDGMRDLSIKIKGSDPKSALYLIKIAARLRPEGKFIQKQLSDQLHAMSLKNTGLCKYKEFILNIGKDAPEELLLAFTNNYYENQEVSLLKKFVSKNDKVLELGAGIGFMGLNAMKFTHCKEYRAYEANPKLIPIIKENMKTNDLFFDIQNAILLNNERKVPFYVTNAFWASSLIKPINNDFKTVEVQSLNKNEVLKSYKPNVLIIDIEGGEYEFFQNLNLDKIEKIILEIHPKVLSDMELTTIYKILIQNNFIIEFNSSYKNVLYFYKNQNINKE